MQVSQKAAPCGAEITNVDLTQQLSSEQVTEIRQAWLEHHVLVFPKQELSVEDLARTVHAHPSLSEVIKEAAWHIAE